MNIGKKMKELRKEAGLSQGQLAKKLGYGSSQFISNWERNISKPPLSKSKIIYKSLKVNKNKYKQMLIDFYTEELEKHI